MGNVCLVRGAWRCACEQDTAHIHVIKAPTHILEITTCNLHILLVLCQLA